MQKQPESPQTEDHPKQDPIDHGIIVAGPDAHQNEGAKQNDEAASPKAGAGTPPKSQDR